MQFSDILASSIHDIKNSLGLILNNLDDLLGNPENHIANTHQASLLQHEAQRANNNLIQLLNLYKLGNGQLTPRITEYNLDDFLEEVVAANHAVCQAMGLELSYRCDPSLSGYFDAELIRGVLDSTIGNARRYARERILLGASREEDYLVLRIEDDGAGFPESLSSLLTEDQSQTEDDLNPSRTRLGLYFASKICELHRTPEKAGCIRLTNHHLLPGGCFELWLP